MRSSKHTLSFLALCAVALLAGCQHGRGASALPDSTRYTLESTEKFLLVDRGAQEAITCTGLQERIGPSGRLEVVANLKNRENRRVRVQARCVFKDDAGFATGDETPWQTLNLSELATEPTTFVAHTSVARKYTVAVRQAR